MFLNVRIDQNVKIIKILVHLTGNFDAPDNDGGTPIHEAAMGIGTEIVKMLVPLTDNPNAPNKLRQTHYSNQF